jgi:hypothetical protein
MPVRGLLKCSSRLQYGYIVSRTSDKLNSHR